jgi:predicted nucleotidyltransferase
MICQAVAGFPAGVSVEGISGVLPVALPRRTLQRRLASLVEQGRLVSEGAGRGCRYRLPSEIVEPGEVRQAAVNRNEALAVLSRVKPDLVARYGVTRLALFGSTARNEARPDSDVDVVVDFDGPATSRRYFGVQFLLEDALGRPVDLVSERAMRSELRPHIEREAINV